MGMSSDPETAGRPNSPGLGAAVSAVVSANLRLIAATALICGLYYAAVPSGGFSIFVPVLVFAGLWLVLFGLNDKADHAAIERADRTPSNGQWTAVCGTATALDDAPGDILACRFQVFDRQDGLGRGGGSDSRDLKCRYDGFYLVPTGIETTESTVKLAGFPDLVHIEKTPLENDLLIRAKEAAFSCPSYLPISVARQMVLKGVMDRVETSLSYGDEPQSSRGETRAWLLRPGDQVCVFGGWKDGALQPAGNRPRGLPVYAGTAEEVRERLKDDSGSFLWVGGVVLAAAAALAAWSIL